MLVGQLVEVLRLNFAGLMSLKLDYVGVKLLGQYGGDDLGK